jgi:hypothetical protein
MKKFFLSLACTAILVLSVTVLSGLLPVMVLLGVVALSVITYLVY